MGMRFNSTVKLMGVEYGEFVERETGKKNPSWKVGLMQGISSKIFYIEQSDYDKLYPLPAGVTIDIVVDFNERNGKMYLKLEDFQIVDEVIKDKRPEFPGVKKPA